MRRLGGRREILGQGAHPRFHGLGGRHSAAARLGELVSALLAVEELG
jgi:hypothetical protein